VQELNSDVRMCEFPTLEGEDSDTETKKRKRRSVDR